MVRSALIVAALVCAGLGALALGPSETQAFVVGSTFSFNAAEALLMNQVLPQHPQHHRHRQLTIGQHQCRHRHWCRGAHGDGGAWALTGRSSRFLPLRLSSSSSSSSSSTAAESGGSSKKNMMRANPSTSPQMSACFPGASGVAALKAAGNIGAAAAATVLRGGGGGIEHNVISGVLAELGNIRTPAALLGGAALGTMFVPRKPAGNKRLHLLYTLLSTSAFTLQLICVLCSTLTYTSVASRPEALAVSSIAYLSEKMQWEFFVIRGSFVYGLFSFLGALSVRGWMTFGGDGDRDSARMMMAVLAATAIFLLNFIHYTHNSLTLCLGGMTKAVVSLTLRNMYATKRRFFRHVFGAGLIWGVVKLLKLGPNEKFGPKNSAPASSPPAAADNKN